MEAFALQLDGFGVRQLGLEFGGGGLIGAVIGFAAKKVAKVIAVIIGIQLALFKFLESRNILQVDWSAITGVAQTTTASAGQAAAGDPPSWLMSILATLPVTAGFTGGFLLGFKKA